jgi:hypothetical protein
MIKPMYEALQGDLEQGDYGKSNADAGGSNWYRATD